MNTHTALPLTLSALSAFVLSACGGSGEASFVGEAGPSFLGDINQPLDPLNLPPSSINKFLTNLNVDSQEEGGMLNQGQQNSPIVASLDLDNNKKVDRYDSVRFDQPGIVAEICTWDGNQTDPQCWDGGQFARLKKAVDDAIEVQNSATERLQEAQATLNGLDPAAPQSEIDAAQAAVDSATQALNVAIQNRQAAEVRFSAPGPTGNESLSVPSDGEVVMRDVNNVIHRVYNTGTIDRGGLKSALIEKLVAFPDAGISKIERIRTRDKDGNEVLKPYGTSIGRAFNSVLVFDRNFQPEDSGKVVPEELQYLDSYFRNPAAADWSFQTFGYFKSKYLDDRRDLIVGYQSIGKPTDNSYSEENRLPDRKFAEYRGISHAYINADKQVTMNNYIKADFGKRKLEYRTSDQAILHTFEGPNRTHVIEVRPDLNISGTASWKKGLPRFQGTVQTASGLHGKMDGQFYGPKAAEVGGVYGIEGIIDGQESHYVGGFGAKRD